MSSQKIFFYIVELILLLGAFVFSLFTFTFFANLVFGEEYVLNTLCWDCYLTTFAIESVVLFVAVTIVWYKLGYPNK